jgi:hypothetical protein
VQTLANVACPNITRYYGSVMQPGSTELCIIMELMACSVADLVGWPAGAAEPAAATASQLAS